MSEFSQSKDRAISYGSSHNRLAVLALTATLGLVSAPTATANTSPLKRAVRTLEERIHHRKPVGVEPNYDVFWAHPGARTTFTNETQDPVKARVGNKWRLFQLFERGNGVKGIVVSPLPERVAKVDSDFIFTASPGGSYAADPFSTTSAVVQVTNNYESARGPSLNIVARHKSGEHTVMPVGLTSPYDSNGILLNADER